MSIWCDRELVRSPIYYALCLTPSAFHRELRRLKVPQKEWPEFLKNSHSDASTHFLECSTGKQAALVCMPQEAAAKQNDIVVIGLLVHEGTHIWQAIRENIGETAPSSEFEAYSMQAIAQQLIAQYRDQIKRQPPRRRVARKRKE